MTPTLRAMAYGQQQKNAVDAADPLSYETILAQTREYISTEHGDALSEVIGNSKSAGVVKRLISQYLTDQSLSLPDMTLDELCLLYTSIPDLILRTLTDTFTVSVGCLAFPNPQKGACNCD